MEKSGVYADRIELETAWRSSEIDFLRGLAIIFVLFRHQLLFYWTQRAGWIGVDLFFVLSGFLVSGLLFREYKTFGNVHPFYFLIRRGFKIYPLFYFSLIISAVLLVISMQGILNYKGILSEIYFQFIGEVFFLQNYLGGHWAHHWSLAVEEHFYILLSIMIFFLGSKKLLFKTHIFISISFLIFVGCLSLRIADGIYSPETHKLYETHFRIDTLFAGVVISYFYHFHFEGLFKFYKRYKVVLAVCATFPFMLAISMEIEYSIFLNTVGLTIIYLGFASLLVIFIFSKRSVTLLKRGWAAYPYAAVSRIGLYSYSIYLFHGYIMKYILNHGFNLEIEDQKFSLQVGLNFIIYFIASIALGMILSGLIERPFLKYRDRYFPSRVKAAAY